MFPENLRTDRTWRKQEEGKMFFTRIAMGLAILAFVSGAFQVAMGIGIASGTIGEEALHRYTSSTTAGAAIDKGFYVLVFAVALGTLAEIRLALRSTKSKNPASMADGAGS